jgi:lysophosphatidic acid acyltransferase/lysophosphatidylinositol acyltransferase
MVALFPFSVSAVYDVTLNFRDKEVPTLLGIVSGKKYMADMNIK